MSRTIWIDFVLKSGKSAKISLDHIVLIHESDDGNASILTSAGVQYTSDQSYKEFTQGFRQLLTRVRD